MWFTQWNNEEKYWVRLIKAYLRPPVWDGFYNFIIVNSLMGLGIPRPQQKTSTHFLDCSSVPWNENFLFLQDSYHFALREFPQKKRKKIKLFELRLIASWTSLYHDFKPPVSTLNGKNVMSFLCWMTFNWGVSANKRFTIISRVALWHDTVTITANKHEWMKLLEAGLTYQQFWISFNLIAPFPEFICRNMLTHEWRFQNA